jgi:ribosomal protein S18 acetylase RimI-like enzyme
MSRFCRRRGSKKELGMTAADTSGLIAKTLLTSAEIADIEQLARICDEHDHARMRVNWDSLANRSDATANDFLYYQDGKLVGALSLYLFGRSVAEASGMVHPAYRRRGIFRALAEAGIGELGRRGVSQLLLFSDHASESGIAAMQALGAKFEHAEHKMELDELRMPTTFDEQLRVERARAEDAGEIARITGEAFGGSEEDGRNYVLGNMDSDTHHYYLARLAGTPIGALTLITGGGEAGIYGFAVLSAYRGRGYGRQILARSIEYALESKPDKVILEVAPENDRALGLYRSVGFRETQRYDYYELDIR